MDVVVDAELFEASPELEEEPVDEVDVEVEVLVEVDAPWSALLTETDLSEAAPCRPLTQELTEKTRMAVSTTARMRTTPKTARCGSAKNPATPPLRAPRPVDPPRRLPPRAPDPRRTFGRSMFAMLREDRLPEMVLALS